MQLKTKVNIGSHFADAFCPGCQIWITDVTFDGTNVLCAFCKTEIIESD